MNLFRIPPVIAHSFHAIKSPGYWQARLRPVSSTAGPRRGPEPVEDILGFGASQVVATADVAGVTPRPKPPAGLVPVVDAVAGPPEEVEEFSPRASAVVKGVIR